MDCQVKKNDTDRACVTYAGKREMCIRFWWENLKERNRLEDLRMDGENIKIRINPLKTKRICFI
jgi:hypothetical protein